MPPGQQWTARIRSFQWLRGLRAFIVLGSIMAVCHLLKLAPGAATLGGFAALLVDNGGPYNRRLTVMSTTLVGGAIAFTLGCLIPSTFIAAIPATAFVCFAAIFARVISQPWTSACLLVLVLYFAGLGGLSHTLPLALFSAGLVLLGGLWAIILSLLFWPFDPFRPAQNAIAKIYLALAQRSANLLKLSPATDPRTLYEARRNQRMLMEEARTALSATVARAPSRTIRARNLTVLLETSDLLHARVVRLAEWTDLSRTAPDSEQVLQRLRSLEEWLTHSERVLYEGLIVPPADGGASFARSGSHTVQFITRRRAELARTGPPDPSPLLTHILTEERDAILEIEVAFDAVYALWSGARTVPAVSGSNAQPVAWDPGWREAVAANWTFSSVSMRHALRMCLVGAVDVAVMRLIHVNHGFWLPMTSIILIQPYSAGTARKSIQRVTGTVTGGIFAATLAAAVPGPVSMIAVIAVLSSLTLAAYAVDYALYTFFLTPAFVLLSLPHFHDWRYTLIRIGTTFAGATIAVLAMRLLWPERAEHELAHLLRRGVEADAEYLRATLAFWRSPSRREAERQILAPARRACGLASNDAEEAVDRLMQEPAFAIAGDTHVTLRNEALTFATYLRRLTQSITTLAAVGRDTPTIHERMARVANRLEALALSSSDTVIDIPTTNRIPAGSDIIEEQVQRIERQAGILERAALNLLPAAQQN